MKSEKETIYDYATELEAAGLQRGTKLEYTLSHWQPEKIGAFAFLTELFGKESVRRRECRSSNQGIKSMIPTNEVSA